MIGLLPAEIKRQIGRRGSFYGAMAWIGVFAVGIFVWALIASDPDGKTAVDSGTGLLIFATVIASVVIGATAGAYDVDQGIMRYLVMTGRPRWQLVLVRVPALIVTVVLVSLPAIVLVVLASFVAGSPSPDSSNYFDLVYGVWMSGFLYGTISLAIGMFMKSSGVAIALAVVLNFAGLLIAGAIVEYVSETLGNAFFPIVAGVVVQHEADPSGHGGFSLAVSALLTAAWLIVLMGAAFARVQRTEY